jgi:uncharacterized protein (TIGR03437 family)
MKYISSLFLFAFLAIGPAFAQTLSGSLSNFDVFNDTGEQPHGFEIELEGLTSKDVGFTFGGTYIRYGDPVLVDFPGGVVVRYASPTDSTGHFTVGTPVPAAFTPTAGHQCWTGGTGGAAVYLASGCEHFGVGMYNNPTAVVYRWLIEDPNAPGTLIRAGSNVNIAAPLWVVTPAPPGGVAVVNAAIAPPQSLAKFGDAVWVKVYETESQSPADLKRLLTDDPSVPQDPAPTEVEWELSQSNPKPGHGLLQHIKPLGKGNQSVTRRFEFYKYTGTYDPATHEALCGQPSTSGKSGGCGALLPGQFAPFIGDYIGAQMAAAQLGPVAAPKMAISGVSDNASGQAGIASGSWVSIYGSGLSATTRSWQNADFQGSNLPVALDGVSVTINGKAAAVWFISPGQLNVQAPSDNATGPVAVQVTNASGSAVGTAALQQYAPGFFTFPGKYAAAVHADGAYVAPVGFFGGAVASRPAQPGEVLLIFGSGFGPTAPAVPAGQVFQGAAALADPSQLHIRIGGIPAIVQYAGMVAAGEYQFNVVVPALTDGDQQLTADIGGIAAQPGLSIPVRN